ncbi:MAG: alanine racemase [Nitrospirota bacterium]|nr:alanine racemase [Nitrospirota bacterium]
MNRGAVAEIDLSAIAYNLRSVRKIVKNRPVIAVVKADAYGHGAVEVSKKLFEENVSFLAVAFTGEAIELREAGIKSPIIVLFDTGYIKEIFDFKLIPVIYNVDTASSLSAEAKKKNIIIKVHVKIDTGMGRLGLSGNHIVNDLIKISEMEGIELVGLLSHFSEADLSDRSYAVLQLKRFNKIRETISKILKRKIFSHIANSAAVLTFEDAHLDAVRPGLMLYGYSPINQKSEVSPPTHPSPARRMAGGPSRGEGEGGGEDSELRTTSPELINLMPAMKVKTKILCIRNVPSGTPISYGRTFITKRPSRIGVLPLGYADGYNRFFSNNAEVLVKGRRVPVVGRICMDLTMIDLTDVKGVKENDEIVIMGKQGKESITAQELAHKATTISYEILTSLGGKSKRIYVETH